MEAILYVSRDMMVIAQNKKLLYAVYGGVMKNLLHNRLLPYLLMIDVENRGKSSRAPRVLVPVSTMSAHGLECWCMALLEIEQQFCGSKGWLLCCCYRYLLHCTHLLRQVRLLFQKVISRYS